MSQVMFEKPGRVEHNWRNAISPIEDIISAARAGQMFILADHEDRENEGDLIIPADFASSEVVNFMATYGRGLICLALDGERVDHLGLALMSTQNSSRHETAFTVSIEAREGVTTGISAHDRALTIAAAIDPEKNGNDLASPGHVFPLRAREGGVLVRAGHTEAAVDIARLAGCSPAGVICEIMNDDGSMARLPDLVGFAQKHALKIGTISDLIAYRRRHDNLLSKQDERTITLPDSGEWTLKTFIDKTRGAEHIALIKGDISGEKPVLVRMHALDPLRDIIGLGGMPRADEFRQAMQIIDKAGRGVLVLIRDLALKMETSDEATPHKLRQYGLGAQILSSIGLSKMTLLTNSPLPDVIGLDAYGLEIVGLHAIEV